MAVLHCYTVGGLEVWGLEASVIKANSKVADPYLSIAKTEASL